MSRAFTNENSQDAAADEAPRLKIPIPAGSRNYVTPEGAAALSEELTRLELVERPALGQNVDKMAKGGADPDELSALRRSLARMDRRIEYLATMAGLAETVLPKEGEQERVVFGCWVDVEDEAGERQSYRIVGVDEADAERGLLGWTSPIARALMGKRPGELARAKLPESELCLKVLAIRGSGG